MTRGPSLWGEVVERFLNIFFVEPEYAKREASRAR
jgi:hypothetical protein